MLTHSAPPSKNCLKNTTANFFEKKLKKYVDKIKSLCNYSSIIKNKIISFNSQQQNPKGQKNEQQH